MAITPQIHIIQMSIQFISIILAKSKAIIEIPKHIRETEVLPITANTIMAANGINNDPKTAPQFVVDFPMLLE